MNTEIYAYSEEGKLGCFSGPGAREGEVRCLGPWAPDSY